MIKETHFLYLEYLLSYYILLSLIVFMVIISLYVSLIDMIIITLEVSISSFHIGVTQ